MTIEMSQVPPAVTSLFNNSAMNHFIIEKEKELGYLPHSILSLSTYFQIITWRPKI